ncbi:MAG: hypothetical protein CSA04_04460 [Bacteroidetes bacterium]|nr:MAG: hypothetical protein CSA04_04460 [Bacteroidota bacterium]
MDSIRVKEEKPTLKIIAKYENNSVVLRWGPNTETAWLMGMQYGYKITRGEFNIEGEEAQLIEKKTLTLDPILPYTVEQFEEAYYRDTTNKMMLVAVQTIHGEWGKGKEESLADIFSGADELSNRFIFNLYAADLNGEAAMASGLAFIDKAVEKDKDYMYKITLDAPPGVFPMDTAFLWVNTKHSYHTPRPIAAKGEEREKMVIINLPRNEVNTFFTAFDIERSRDGIHFNKLNDKPFVHALPLQKRLQSNFISYTDSVENYIPYYYRIAAYTPFGEKSPYSDTLFLMGRDKTPAGTAYDIKATYIEGKGAEITWHFDGDYEDLQGFIVKSAKKFTGPYTPIREEVLDKDTFLDYDPNMHKLEPLFYLIETIDTAGNTQASLQTYCEVLDSIAPEKPTGLAGEIDSTGVVKLHWNYNPEEDVIGYQIYFSNSKNNAFTQVTNGPIPALDFSDTISIKTLTRHGYYKITAVDFKFNISEFSDILTITRPDIIPPNPPVFTHYDISETGVLLNWAPSSSNDVDYHLILRKEEQGAWEEVYKSTGGDMHFLDTTPRPGVQYYYKILAIDQSGLSSNFVNILPIKSPKFKLDDGVKNFRYETQASSILLHWESAAQPVHSYLIYRESSDRPLHTIATVTGDTNTYEDKHILPNTEYGYYLKARFKNGEESAFSEKLSVQTKHD